MIEFRELFFKWFEEIQKIENEYDKFLLDFVSKIPDNKLKKEYEWDILKQNNK
jgi:hypothetical protein